MTLDEPSGLAQAKPNRSWTKAADALLRSAPFKADADAMLFSAKSYAAAMASYSIALGIGLPRPYWAIVTVYVVSQPSAAASLSRGVYRLAGTLVGAAATVLIIPTFVNAPLVCSLALAGWIGLCLYVSLLDRTARAYAFVLAGYTASLIGFPSVADPGAVFELASVRVQEIALGILCAVLIHRFILPKPITGAFTGKLLLALRDGRTLAVDALAGTPAAETRSARHQLAADLLVLQGLATQLPYDPAPETPKAGKLRLVHDRLARLLPLTADIEHRMEALAASQRTAPEGLAVLVTDIQAWTRAANPDEDEAAMALIARARSLQARLGLEAMTTDERLAANLAGHLAELIELLRDADRLGRDIAARGRSATTISLHRSRTARGYIYHRDPVMAARAALGAAAGVLIGCAFWIWSAWPDGGLAVSLLGVTCALFGNVDKPAPNVIKYLTGSIWGVAISLAYSFVILPRVSDFTVLAAVLAPAFLVAGSLQARPATAYAAMGVTLTIPILAGLGARYHGDFAASVNSAVALFVALGFAVVSMAALQTVPAETAIDRLLSLSRRDVGRRARGESSDEAHWTSLMVDRAALLLPRTRQTPDHGPDTLDEILRHLRLGHAAGRLRKAVQLVQGEVGEDARALLSAIAKRFGPHRRSDPAEARRLVERTEDLMATVAGGATMEDARLLDLLIDLRFALASQAPAGGARAS